MDVVCPAHQVLPVHRVDPVTRDAMVLTAFPVDQVRCRHRHARPPHRLHATARLAHLDHLDNPDMQVSPETLEHPVVVASKHHLVVPAPRVIPESPDVLDNPDLPVRKVHLPTESHDLDLPAHLVIKDRLVCPDVMDSPASPVAPDFPDPKARPVDQETLAMTVTPVNQADLETPARPEKSVFARNIVPSMVEFSSKTVQNERRRSRRFIVWFDYYMNRCTVHSCEFYAFSSLFIHTAFDIVLSMIIFLLLYPSRQICDSPLHAI